MNPGLHDGGVLGAVSVNVSNNFSGPFTGWGDGLDFVNGSFAGVADFSFVDNERAGITSSASPGNLSNGVSTVNERHIYFDNVEVKRIPAEEVLADKQR